MIEWTRLAFSSFILSVIALVLLCVSLMPTPLIRLYGNTVCRRENLQKFESYVNLEGSGLESDFWFKAQNCLVKSALHTESPMDVFYLFNTSMFIYHLKPTFLSFKCMSVNTVQQPTEKCPLSLSLCFLYSGSLWDTEQLPWRWTHDGQWRRFGCCHWWVTVGDQPDPVTAAGLRRHGRLGPHRGEVAYALPWCHSTGERHGHVALLSTLFSSCSILPVLYSHSHVAMQHIKTVLV